MSKVLKTNLSFDDFLYKLRQEYDYHKSGGTSYREETAKLSLDVAMKVGKVTPFLSPSDSRRLVFYHLPSLDNHRKNDVVKMLRVLAKSLYLEQNTPSEVREYVKNKMKHKLVLKKL